MLRKANTSDWPKFQAKWSGCTRCGIHACTRRKIHFRGEIPCSILFVGLAPGPSEEASNAALPFVGPAGGIFDSIVEDAIEGKHTWAATNLISCFPQDGVGFRDPTLKEIVNCVDRLVEFIQMAKPQILITLGRLARDNVPKRLAQKYLHCYHPSYFLPRKNTNADMEVKRIKAALELREGIAKFFNTGGK